jgi:hypothetical protein
VDRPAGRALESLAAPACSMRSFQEGRRRADQDCVVGRWADPGESGRSCYPLPGLREGGSRRAFHSSQTHHAASAEYGAVPATETRVPCDEAASAGHPACAHRRRAAGHRTSVQGSTQRRASAVRACAVPCGGGCGWRDLGTSPPARVLHPPAFDTAQKAHLRFRVRDALRGWFTHEGWADVDRVRKAGR